MDAGYAFVKYFFGGLFLAMAVVALAGAAESIADKYFAHQERLAKCEAEVFSE